MNNTCPKSFGIRSLNDQLLETMYTVINLHNIKFILGTDSLMSTILWSSIGGVTALCCVILFIIIVILLMVKRKG